MPVARDEGAEVFFAAFAGGGEGEVFGEAFDAFGLAAGHEDGLADVDVGNGLGELEAELGVVEARLGEVLADFEGANGEIAGDGAMDEGFGGGWGVEVVIEIGDLTGEEGAILVEFGDFEAAVTGGIDIHAAVVVGFGDTVNACGAADGGDAIFEGEDDAEFAIRLEGLIDHEFVTFFKDMEGEAGTREEDEAKGKEGEQGELGGGGIGVAGPGRAEPAEDCP